MASQQHHPSINYWSKLIIDAVRSYTGTYNKTLNGEFSSLFIINVKTLLVHITTQVAFENILTFSLAILILLWIFKILSLSLCVN